MARVHAVVGALFLALAQLWMYARESRSDAAKSAFVSFNHNGEKRSLIPRRGSAYAPPELPVVPVLKTSPGTQPTQLVSAWPEKKPVPTRPLPLLPVEDPEEEEEDGGDDDDGTVWGADTDMDSSKKTYAEMTFIERLEADPRLKEFYDVPQPDGTVKEIRYYPKNTNFKFEVLTEFETMDQQPAREEDQEKVASEESSSVALGFRTKYEIMKVLPETYLMNVWARDNAVIKQDENNPVYFLQRMGGRPFRQHEIKRKVRLWQNSNTEWKRKLRNRADTVDSWQAALLALPKNPWSALAKASVEDKELFAKVSTAQARDNARENEKKKRGKPHVGHDVGTGPESPHAYVEIKPRWGGPEKEAANIVVAQALGIPPEQASRLVDLGSVWAFDEGVREWLRIEGPVEVWSDQVLRVFPNPERFKTCYVTDWSERIKFQDQDFVVIDKPPLLPCFAKVCNGREALSPCLKGALSVRKYGGHGQDMVDDELVPCNGIEDEASGLVVLSRHDKGKEIFEEWLEDEQVVFEFVALTQGTPTVGIHRHFFPQEPQRDAEQPKPPLQEDIPKELVPRSRDYEEWGIAEMEVVSTAELPGGVAAVRIRTTGHGLTERIRSQLALLGTPILNDVEAEQVSATDNGEAADPNHRLGAGAGEFKMPGQEAAEEEEDSSRKRFRRPFGRGPAPTVSTLGGAVDAETLRGPYGRKLRLLPYFREAASRGVPQMPRKKVPIALHLARIEFGGRVVTCAPPKYWPEGAAAAVALQLTTKDLKSKIQDFLVTEGGWSRIRRVGGHFSVKVEWLEEQFVVDRTKGLVFASDESKGQWDSEQRVKSGDRAWDLPAVKERRKAYRDKMHMLKTLYLKPKDLPFGKPPTWKELRKNKYVRYVGK